MVPNQAGCHRHVGKQVPSPGCTCGLYAVASLDRLPIAFGMGSSIGVSVVGSVAMWGRVVEHVQGYRGQLAYPDRIRLICRECFFSGRQGVPTRIELGPQGALAPVCDVHASVRGSGKGTTSPAELEQMLRSTYAVDLLPIEALEDAGFGRGRPPPPTFVAAAKTEARQLSRSGSGVLAIVLLVLAGIVMNIVGPFPTTGRGETAPNADRTPQVIPIEGPFADDAVSRPPVEIAHPPSEPVVVPRFGLVCGHRVGTAVRVMACGRPRAELMGGFERPRSPRRDCIGTWFTRKQNLSVCWFGIEGDLRWGPDLLRLPGVHLRDLR